MGNTRGYHNDEILRMILYLYLLLTIRPHSPLPTRLSPSNLFPESPSANCFPQLGGNLRGPLRTTLSLNTTLSKRRHKRAVFVLKTSAIRGHTRLFQRRTFLLVIGPTHPRLSRPLAQRNHQGHPRLFQRTEHGNKA